MANQQWGAIFIQASAPDGSGVAIGHLWADTNAGQLKKCSSISPITFVPINQAATDGDLASQTVSNNPLLLIDAATATSVQTAITNIVNDLNDLKAKLRTAGVLAT